MQRRFGEIMRLIDADRLKTAFIADLDTAMGIYDGDMVRLMLIDIDDCPTISPENLRPHGRIISTGYDELYCEFGDCTVCGADNPMHNKYCWKCGAKMDGGVEDV